MSIGTSQVSTSIEKRFHRSFRYENVHESSTINLLNALLTTKIKTQKYRQEIERG